VRRRQSACRSRDARFGAGIGDELDKRTRRIGGMVAAATNLGSGLGAVGREARWGALNRVRSWLGSESPRERPTVERRDPFDGSTALLPDLTVIWQADPTFDRRAASLALHEALSEWRAGERSLIAMSAETSDIARAEGEVTVLRAAYQQRVQAVRTGLLEE
jgi:hypothetical protein